MQRLRRIRDVARSVYGYANLRPEQEEAITAVLDGHDTLAVMPTGSGKSAIYQIAALMIDGPTVIVSPLIALQKDQADFLQDQEAGGATVINSMVSPGEVRSAFSEAANGSTEFLFLAPEQFSNAARMDALKAVRPSLIVIDEAHCISEWGHSFRPDYLRLGAVIEALGHPTVLALTATANAEVRQEIVARLGMRNPEIFIQGFDRPNIWLGVEVAASESKKRSLLLERIRAADKPGIIYTSTRKHAEEIRDELDNIGIQSAVYHAGLAKRDRNRTHEEFMNGTIDVMVATCAFGMGVDKSNVRFVFHFAPPDSIDSYYQEIGRAGRDGLPAVAVLFYSASDLTIHRFFKGGGQIGEADALLVLELLENDGGASENELRKKTKLSKIKLARVLSRLEDCGGVEIDSAKMVRLKPDCADFAVLARQAAEGQSALHDAEISRIEQMGAYASSLECRRAGLITYFGEPFPASCGNCDNCQGSGTLRAELIARTRTEIGDSFPGSLAEAARECAQGSGAAE